jgi:hypothetical protein
MHSITLHQESSDVTALFLLLPFHRTLASRCQLGHLGGGEEHHQDQHHLPMALLASPPQCQRAASHARKHHRGPGRPCHRARHCCHRPFSPCSAHALSLTAHALGLTCSAIHRAAAAAAPCPCADGSVPLEAIPARAKSNSLPIPPSSVRTAFPRPPSSHPPCPAKQPPSTCRRMGPGRYRRPQAASAHDSPLHGFPAHPLATGDTAPWPKSAVRLGVVRDTGAAVRDKGAVRERRGSRR